MGHGAFIAVEAKTPLAKEAAAMAMAWMSQMRKLQAPCMFVQDLPSCDGQEIEHG